MAYMKLEDVYPLCVESCALNEIPDSPSLLLAMCLQESSLDPEARRLEQNFFRKYVKSVIPVHPVDQVLFSTSWGLMQTMGEAMYRAGYFGGRENEQGYVYGRIKEYLKQPYQQVQIGGLWLKTKIKAAGSLDKGIWMYNGNPDYLQIIRDHQKTLQRKGFK